MTTLLHSYIVSVLVAVHRDLYTHNCRGFTPKTAYPQCKDLPSAMLAILVLFENSISTSAIPEMLSVAHSHFRPLQDSKLLAGFRES